eukprot:3859539-Pleurochrysis_carterae.AAC.1
MFESADSNSLSIGFCVVYESADSQVPICTVVQPFLSETFSSSRISLSGFGNILFESADWALQYSADSTALIKSCKFEAWPTNLQIHAHVCQHHAGGGRSEGATQQRSVQ